MKKLSLVLFLTIFFSLSISAFALPTIASKDNTAFLRYYSPTAFSGITITDDATTPAIKADNDIRIQIPSSINAIFDEENTKREFTVEGTAVTNGKISTTPAITFEDKDKTVVIPVDKDFTAGESVTIYKLYARGFNELNGTPLNLELIYDKNATSIKDVKTITVTNSTYTDKTPPQVPTNVKITQTSDTSVKLTWTNPTDLDVILVKILRGLNYFPVSSSPYNSVGKGVEEFTDTGLKVGDKVKYQLGAEDSLNAGKYTDIYEYTLVNYADIQKADEEAKKAEDAKKAEEAAKKAEEDAKKAAETAKANEDASKTTTETGEKSTVTPTITFSDVSAHWAKTVIEKMVEKKIVKGNPDGKFAPDAPLNRAESSAMLYRILKLKEPDPTTEKPFSDVESNKWYAGYISYLKDLKLISGNPDGSFKPSENINRAQFLAMAMNMYYFISDATEKAAIDALKKGEQTKAYMDLKTDWYTSIVTAATKKGFIGGLDCGNSKCFNANASITRAEAVAIIDKMFNTYLETSKKN